MREYCIEHRTVDGKTRWDLYKLKHADDVAISMVGLILTSPVSIPLVLYAMIFKGETITPFFYNYLYTVYTEEEATDWSRRRNL